MGLTEDHHDYDLVQILLSRLVQYSLFNNYLGRLIWRGIGSSSFAITRLTHSIAKVSLLAEKPRWFYAMLIPLINFRQVQLDAY